MKSAWAGESASTLIDAPFFSGQATLSCFHRFYRVFLEFRYLIKVPVVWPHDPGSFSIGFIRFSASPCFASRCPILNVATHSASTGATLGSQWFQWAPCRNVCPRWRAASSRPDPMRREWLFSIGFIRFPDSPCYRFFWPSGKPLFYQGF